MRELADAIERIRSIGPTENIDIVGDVNGSNCIGCLTNVASSIVGLNDEKRMQMGREENLSYGYGIDHKFLCVLLEVDMRR